MKTIKATPTIIITGWFRKRYWLLLPEDGVFEIPVNTIKDQIKGKTNA